MHTMMPSTGVPPYNRFDKIPRHALQCGLSDTNKEQQYYNPTSQLHNNGEGYQHSGIHGHTSNTPIDLSSYQPSFCNQHTHHTTKLDSTGSRNSIASTISTNSHNSSDKISESKGSLDSLLTPLYVEQSEPPPYTNKQDTLGPDSMRRAQLPKKSPAAQQVVADLLKSERPHILLGNCYGCRKQILEVKEACQAMGETYHNSCFTCHSCGRMLIGKAFYSIQGKVYCEEDYMYSGFQQNIEKCYQCGHLIMDTILKAMGRSFHPGCFRCTECNDSLDGIQFTVDTNENVYCIKDFYRLYAPKCAACGDIILPIDGSDETVRVVALDKDYHVDCYHCEKCKAQLTDEPDKRCYPIGDHLLCYGCHIDIRTTNLPSPGASSTSSGHSSSSFTVPQGRVSPGSTNGHISRKSSSLSHNKPLLYNTIPEESVRAANHATTSNTPRQSPTINDKLPKLATSLFSNNPFAVKPELNPNQRLHDKIMQHVKANKDFKLPNQTGSTLSKLLLPSDTAPKIIRPHTNANMPVTHSETQKRESGTMYKSIVTYTPKSPSAPISPAQLPSTPVGKEPLPPRQKSITKSATPVEMSMQPIAPRAIPIDHAVPQPSLRRMHGTRRRAPLSDIIMQKKIAESLQRSLSNSGKHASTSSRSTMSSGESRSSVSPQSDRTRHSPSPTRTRTPSPPLPYYMKAWQASEIAQSISNNNFPVAIAQKPVQAQELPPRIVGRRQSKSQDVQLETPPERPPKLKSFHIAKI